MKIPTPLSWEMQFKLLAFLLVGAELHNTAMFDTQSQYAQQQVKLWEHGH